MFRWCVFLNPKKARTSISPILFTANSFTQIYLRQSAGLPINHWHEMWTAPTSTVVRLYLNRVETWALEEVTGRPPPVSLWPPPPPSHRELRCKHAPNLGPLFARNLPICELQYILYTEGVFPITCLDFKAAIFLFLILVSWWYSSIICRVSLPTPLRNLLITPQAHT